MAEQEKTYPEINRRKNCNENCPFADQAKKSVPRVYIFAMIPVVLFFTGWHISSMDKLREENRVSIQSFEVHMNHAQMVHKDEMDRRMADVYKNYSTDLAGFIRTTREIRLDGKIVIKKINNLEIKIAEIKTMQDLVIKKIKLTE